MRALDLLPVSKASRQLVCTLSGALADRQMLANGTTVKVYSGAGQSGGTGTVSIDAKTGQCTVSLSANIDTRYDYYLAVKA